MAGYATRRSRQLHAHRLTLIVALLCCGALSRQLCAGGDISLEVVSAWGGPVNDIHIEGAIAYAAVGRRLVVLDISDIDAIVELGSVDLERTVRAIAYRDGYVFAGVDGRFVSGSHVFCSVDVSDPAHPTIAWVPPGPLPSPFGFLDRPERLRLHGDYIYALYDRRGIQIFDISDPTDVQYLGSASGGAGGSLVESEDFGIIGDHMYVVNFPASLPLSLLRVYDISRSGPLSPQYLGATDFLSVDPVFNHTAYKLSVDGDLAFVLLDVDKLVVISLADPRNPAIIGSYAFNDDNPVKLSDVCAAGGFVYVADYATEALASAFGSWNQSNGLMVFDVTTNPRQPALVATYKTHGAIRQVRAVGDRAYLFDDGEGLIVMDISSPANLVRLGNYHSPAFLRKMVRAGDLVYIVDSWNGFTILDVSNPGQTPTVVGVYQTPFDDADQNTGIANCGIVVQDGLAYLAAGYAGVHVVEVTDPAQPDLIQVLPGMMCYRSAGIAIKDGFAHVGYQYDASFGDCLSTCLPWNLRSYDLTTGAYTTLVVGGCIAATRLVISEDDVAFVGRNAGIAGSAIPQAIDVSDPVSAFLIAPPGQPLPPPATSGQHAVDVALQGNVLFIANNDTVSSGDGLYIRDVSNPAMPVELDFVDGSPTATTAVDVQNSRAYLVSGGVNPNGNHVQVYDLSSPTSPVLLDSVPVGSYGAGISDNPDGPGLLVDEPLLFLTAAVDSDPVVGGLVIFGVNGLPQSIPADLNGDGVVNTLDLGILLSSWTIPPRTVACGGAAPCPADINHDGVVNTLDLGILLSSWTL